MTSPRLAIRILNAVPLWLRRPFVKFSIDVVSTMHKGLPAADMMAMTLTNTNLSEDATQMLFDLSMRKLDSEWKDTPKPPPKDSTLLVLAGPHKGRLATMGLSQFNSKKEVELWVKFADGKFAVLSCSDVKEITPPEWQDVAAETKLRAGDLIWGAHVNQQNTGGPALTMWDDSQTVDALPAAGYTKWLNTFVDLDRRTSLTSEPPDGAQPAGDPARPAHSQSEHSQ